MRAGAIFFAVLTDLSMLYMNRTRIFGDVFGRSFEVSADSLFSHEFETSQSEASGLAGSGSMWMDQYHARAIRLLQ
ncbi:MAG: hypothetical protein WBM26_05765 [Polyangiales bacterium]